MLEELIQQLPNFAGLIVCIMILLKVILDLQKTNAELIKVIIEQTNCPESNSTPSDAILPPA